MVLIQIEYGDWHSIASSAQPREFIEKEALERFCPAQFLHMALQHDQRYDKSVIPCNLSFNLFPSFFLPIRLLQDKLIVKWKALVGLDSNVCAHRYLDIAEKWELYGAALFQAIVRRNHMQFFLCCYYIYFQ